MKPLRFRCAESFGRFGSVVLMLPVLQQVHRAGLRSRTAFLRRAADQPLQQGGHRSGVERILLTCSPQNRGSDRGFDDGGVG